MFKLDDTLRNDTLEVGNFGLSVLLMSRDANYPWFILVPRRAGVTELVDLEWQDRVRLLEESSRLSEALMAVFGGDKLNIATLGNLVAQLHVHHIVRFRSDPAWPAPVWGRLPALEESDDFYQARIDAVRRQLGECLC